jgi:hypothetical protein
MTTAALPSLSDLGSDLLVTTPRQRWVALTRPYLGVAAFALAAWQRWWWLTPALFLELTYHLEHHLYPQVPSHHLAQLARRLDPYFAHAGVRPRRVI